MALRHNVIALTAAAFCSASFAEHADNDLTSYSFNGFGSVGITHSSEKQADFTSNPLLGGGVGYSRHWSPTVDSRLAGQLSAQFTPALSGVIQAVVERRLDASYRPRLEWANLRYQVSPELSMRAGRIALPILMAAEYRKVGYAVPWVRTPVEVYGLVPITTSDGVDASYRTRRGRATNTVKVSWGRNDVRLGDGYETARIDDLVGISNVIEFGATMLRAGYIRSSVSVPSAQPFFDAFRAFGERGAVLADRYEMRDKKTSVLSMGGSYDPGQWFVTAEWARTSTHSVLANKEGWYAGGGYRTGNLTPFITYAQVRTLSPKAEPGIPTSGLTSSAAVVATRLNTTLNYYLSSSPDQKTVAIGARWDFSKDVAVTVQYDRIALGPGSQGMLVNRQPDFTPGGTVHVASAVVHFLF